CDWSAIGHLGSPGGAGHNDIITPARRKSCRRGGGDRLRAASRLQSRIEPIVARPAMCSESAAEPRLLVEDLDPAPMVKAHQSSSPSWVDRPAIPQVALRAKRICN